MYEVYGHELCNHLLCNVCLYNKTKITVTLLQTLFLLFQNGFELSSSQDNYQIGKRSRVKNQSFKARQVDVTAKFSTSLNPSINRDEDLENKCQKTERQHTSKDQYSVQKRRKQTSTTQRILPIVFILEFLSVQKNIVCSVSYCIVNTSDCISSIQNLIQFFVIAKLSLFQL